MAFLVPTPTVESQDLFYWNSAKIEIINHVLPFYPFHYLASMTLKSFD